MINLGWANNWKETPEVVLKCREQEHPEKGLTEGQADHVRCVSTSTCRLCGYTYKVDSSD